MDKTSKTLSKLITYLLVILLCLGVAGGIVSIIQNLTKDKGLYIEYNGNQYFTGTDGIVLTSDEFEFVDLYLFNTEDWEDYSVSDYLVRIVPYNTDDYDFYYRVNDTRYTFSSITDLSSGFIYDYANYDGNGLQVSDNGAISLYINDIVFTSGSCDMQSFLKYVLYHSFTSSSDRVALLTSYPDFTEVYCFAINVISPDGDSVLEVPVMLDITNVSVQEDSSGGSGGGSGTGSDSGSGGYSGSDSGAAMSSSSSFSTSSDYDISGDDEEVDTAITYELYNVTALCDLPSTIDEITGDEITFTFSVNSGCHISDSYSGSDYSGVYYDDVHMVGYVSLYSCSSSWSYVAKNEVVTVTISTSDLSSGFNFRVEAEKTHYIYLDLSGCSLYGFKNISSSDITQLIPYDYIDRGGYYLEYYESYGTVQLCLSSDDGYSFWYYTDEEHTEISYDNYSYSIGYTGNYVSGACFCTGYNSYGLWFYIRSSDLDFSQDFSITIHVSCYEEV